MNNKWVYILTLMMILFLPFQTSVIYAESLDESKYEKNILYSDSKQQINLYKDSEMKDIIVSLPVGTKVLVKEKVDSNISFVHISSKELESIKGIFEENENLMDSKGILQGYVYSESIELKLEQEVVTSSPVEDELTAEVEGEIEEDLSEASKENNSNKENLENKTTTEELQEDIPPTIQTNTETKPKDTTESVITTNSLRTISYKSISRLGHIRSSNVDIYNFPGGKSFKAGSQYTNAVYYIKRQAKIGSEIYYLLSTSPSASKNTVGWVKTRDLSTRVHFGVDKRTKIFFINGKGKATTKAWGGSKDTVHSNMMSLQGESFQVNLTEKVGNNTWYRGKINGEGSNVWLHSSYVLDANLNSTSLLGHIRSGNVNLYNSPGGKSFKAGSQYTNAVYYIKQEAKVNNDTYYLLSTQPSATKGVVAWAKASDLSTHVHVGVDRNPKIFGIKGNGKATTKAWGGNKDNVHASLTSQRGKTLHVNLTERVGNNIWYRGKIDGKGQNVWLHSSYVEAPQESSTSRLGHIRSGNVPIYKNLGGQSFKAGSQYTNAVYYIKRQSKVGNITYYLLSTSPSATKGVIGWAKSSDLSTHAHVGVDRKSKIFEIKGNGKATTKAWGGSKDNVHANLSSQKGKLLHVDLTERVGNNIWYRGKINGEGRTVWVHSSYVSSVAEKSISRLGHIRSSNVDIYTLPGGKSSKAGSKYTNAVYYIKKEITVNKQKYYLLSTSPSATKNTIGWAKASDLSTHSHTGVNKHSKTLQFKGTGKAYTKAWGGSKDLVYGNMSQHKGKHFHVNLTEKVGNNIWYRGKVNGQGANVWIHSSYVESAKKIIVIDAGHGGSDPGASANGLIEKNLTLDISKRIESLLLNDGYTVIMTRTNDSSHSLADRSKKANDANADLFMSIHINAGGGRGIETWWNDKNSNPKESEQLAKDVQSEIIKSTKANDRGVKGRTSNRGNFHVTREPKMPSALVEVGFIDTKSDADKLKDKNFLQLAAQGVVNGIKKFFS